MLILLPPSETKRPGGDGAPLALDALRFADALRVPREAALAAAETLSSDLETAVAVLGLGPKSRDDALLNRALRTSPTMPAIDRFDGVLYDAMDAATLPRRARGFAAEHVLISSAMFGAVGALDPIPAYRLSPDSRLPVSLRSLWRDPVGTALDALGGFVLDLRSDGYRELGPVPGATYLHVVTDGPDGARRALNHFNKHGKGEFVRRILLSGIAHPDARSLLRWARRVGIRLEQRGDGDLDLVVDGVPAARRAARP